MGKPARVKQTPQVDCGGAEPVLVKQDRRSEQITARRARKENPKPERICEGQELREGRTVPASESRAGFLYVASEA